MSDEEELEFWELLHLPLGKDSAEKFQNMFDMQRELRINRKNEDKFMQITSKTKENSFLLFTHKK